VVSIRKLVEKRGRFALLCSLASMFVFTLNSCGPTSVQVGMVKLGAEKSLGTVQAPAFGVTPGEYGSAQTITLSSATSGATIRYTLDGSLPTSSSTIYSEPISISTSTTIKAIATKEQWTDSIIVEGFYQISGVVSDVVFSVDSGLINSSFNLTLSTPTADAAIFYTLDGSTPTVASTRYTGAIAVTSSKTVKAFATKSKYLDSNVKAKTYTLIISKGVEAFADTACFTGTNTSCISWIPKTAFDLDMSVDFGLYGNTSGTGINSVGTIPLGRSILSANSVPHSADTATVYAKDQNSNYVNLGTYQTRYPASYSIPGVPGSAQGGSVTAMLKDAVSVGCTTSPNCVILFGSFSIPASNGTARYVAKILPDGNYVSMDHGLDQFTTLDVLYQNQVAINSVGHVFAVGSLRSSDTSTTRATVLKWNGALWSKIDDGFSGVWLGAMTVDSSDNLYLSGSFVCFDGSTSSGLYPNNTCSGAGGSTVLNNIAKWNGATWHPLGSGLHADVGSMAVGNDGYLYVTGGLFQNVYRFSFANLTWSPVGVGQSLGEWPSQIKLDSSGKIYVYSLDPASYFDRLSKSGVSYANASTSVTMTSTSGLYPGMSVYGLGIPTGTTIVSVNSATSISISQMTTSSRSNMTVRFQIDAGEITIYDPITNQWTPMQTQMATSDSVSKLLFDSSNNIYAVGSFTCLKGSTPSGVFPNNTCSGTGGTTVLNNIAKWNGSSWTSIGSGVNGTPTTFVIDGAGSIYASGSFTKAGNAINANGFAKWNGVGWAGHGQGMNGAVRAMAKDSSGNIYLVGDFTAVGTISANRIARWDGASWSTFGVGINGSVNSIALDSVSSGCSELTPCIYVAGNFTAAGSVSANGVAKWNGSSWVALGSVAPTNWGDQAKVVFDSNRRILYVSGGILSIDGLTVNGLAKWNGVSWGGLGAGITYSGSPGRVWALALDSGGNLYAGGDFDAAGGVVSNNIAMWNGTGWSAVGTGCPDLVVDLISDGDDLFANVQGSNANLLRWNGSSWTDTTPVTYWPHSGKFSKDLSGAVLIPFNGNSGPQSGKLGRWNGSSWVLTDIPVESDSAFGIIYDESGNIYLGGSFTNIGSKFRPYFGKWMTTFGEAQ
jgi:hypothetical protein